MVAILGTVVFASAFAVSVAVIAAMIAPQWRRIARLAAGHREEPFAPLAQLAVAERHIAVRRWASRSSAFDVSRLRAAA